MNDDNEIIEELRKAGLGSSPVQIAERLAEIWQDGLTASALVMFFRRAFPEIPLRTMLNGAAWCRVGQGGMSDEEFNELLSPWLPRAGNQVDGVLRDRENR